MASRLELQTLLESILGSRNVYYQKPEGKKMSYPAIVYNVEGISSDYANDSRYINKKRYSLIVASRTPDNTVIEELLNIQYCSYDRQYKSDGLYHDVLTLYY